MECVKELSVNYGPERATRFRLIAWFGAQYRRSAAN
jgi:hypothetical protein